MKDDLASSSSAGGESPRRSREHRRRRFRRHRRRAFIRSVYSLPSLATLGNALCGFASMYVAALVPTRDDPWAAWFGNTEHKFIIAAYFIFLAMLFDALDGRLARFTRHTTDFGGQLDSLADVISFGLAPAFLAILVFKDSTSDLPGIPLMVHRLIWAVGALYVSCGAIRLARFNVSNQHGEQHHFSFLGLPIPGAAGAVTAWILMQRYFFHDGFDRLAGISLWLLPVVVLCTGLLMVSTFRYPHVVNRYLRGRRSFAQLLAILAIVLLLVVAHQITIALGTFFYALWGVTAWAYARTKPKPAAARAP